MNPRLQKPELTPKDAVRPRPSAHAAPPAPLRDGADHDRTGMLQRLRGTPPVLQRVNGEIRAATPVIQRMTLLTDTLGEGYVAFAKTETMPNRFGALPGDPDWVYRIQPKYEDDEDYQDVVVYKREPKVRSTMTKRVIDKDAEALRKKLVEAKKAQAELFDSAHGGGVEGTFEYVANYLYAEVPQANKQEIWDQVWDTRIVGNDVVRSVKPDIPRRRRIFLAKLITLGLKTTNSPRDKKPWKPKDVLDIAKIKVVEPAEGDTKPGDVRPKPVGIGFHTTEGAPDTVLKSKAAGGWGGILQTMTVPFFRKRYALDAYWNPLGQFLVENGPVFRITIQDNELLSTVSVATDSHATVRFPLWTPSRSGQHDELNPKGERSFKMDAWLYVVAVREAYVTYEHQDNPFGEIATASILPTDVIGWCKLTRWHDYDDYPTQVATADFYYALSPLQRNPLFGNGTFQDKIVNAANESVEAERNLAKQKHVSAT